MNISIRISDTSIIITGDDRKTVVNQILDYITSPSAPPIVVAEAPATKTRIKSSHINVAEFPDRFTFEELASKLQIPRSTAYTKTQSALRTGHVVQIGKKWNGRHVFQRSDAKNPMVCVRPNKSSVLFTPATAKELEQFMPDVAA